MAKVRAAFEHALMIERIVKRAIEFPNQSALEEYLKEHPDADPKNHSVKDHSRGEDRSSHPNVIEYGAQSMLKGKSPSAAAKDLVKKFHGHENMFFGPGPTHLDVKKVEDQLWNRLAEHTIKSLKSFKPEKSHWTLGGTLEHFNQKKTPKMREELKKRVIKELGKDPFEHDDGS